MVLLSENTRRETPFEILYILYTQLGRRPKPSHEICCYRVFEIILDLQNIYY